MRYRKFSIKCLFIIAITVSMLLAACSAQKPSSPPVLTKVIVSDLGELTRNACYPGEKVSYKIFYINNTAQVATISIADQLSSDLTEIKVFDGGRYNRTSHTIFWEVAGLSPGSGGYVAFEAIVNGKGTIENQARQYR